MLLPKKLLFVILIPALILFVQEGHVIADDAWQLDGSHTELSDAEEIELGKQLDEYIRHQFYLDKDPKHCKIVNDIIQKLVIVSDRKTLPFTCDIIQSYSINAFFVPGGHIYLTDGLLKFAKSEDEVAGIIGHEIAHASLRHVSKLYYEFLEIFSQKNRGTDFDTTLLLLNSQLEEFEQDADTVGVLYAHKAGFDPNGLPDFLERHLDLLINNRIFGLLRFDSFVTINSRINHLREYIPTLVKQE